MVCRRFLCAVSFFCLVSQLFAYKFVRANEGAIHQILEIFPNLQGHDVTSEAYDNEKRNRICEIGDDNHNHALLYRNANIYQTDHSTTQIKVSFPNAVEVQGVSPDITMPITVIACATNDNTGDVFYFGRGPVMNSVAVYAKQPTDEVGRCFGMLTEVYG